MKRSRHSWIAIGSWLGAFFIGAGALVRSGQSPAWLVIAALAGASLVLLAWRRKAAVPTDATFATSADLLVGGKQFPGELSVTASALVWSPNGYSIKKGLSPLSAKKGERLSVTMQAGPALLDVTISVRQEGGAEWLFRTHRSPRLRNALARLT